MTTVQTVLPSYGSVNMAICVSTAKHTGVMKCPVKVTKSFKRSRIQAQEKVNNSGFDTTPYVVCVYKDDLLV